MGQTESDSSQETFRVSPYLRFEVINAGGPIIAAYAALPLECVEHLYLTGPVLMSGNIGRDPVWRQKVMTQMRKSIDLFCEDKDGCCGQIIEVVTPNTTLDPRTGDYFTITELIRIITGVPNAPSS